MPDAQALAADELLFDAAFLKKLEYLHVVSRRVFAGHFRAERRARTRGSGQEFADHREYTPGDDFRRIDWLAYQRLERLLIRLFEEEQDLPIYLFVDCSRSMTHDNRPRFQYGLKVAAALCYIGLAELDRVTLAGYAERVVAELPAQRGKARILKVFRFLGSLEPGGATDTREALRGFCAVHRSRGISVIISDFLDPAGFERGLDVLRSLQHDVVAIHLTSRTDAVPDLRGDLVLVDAETSGRCEVGITPAILAAYERAHRVHSEELAAYCWRHRFGYLPTPIEIPFEDAILKLFRQGRFLT